MQNPSPCARRRIPRGFADWQLYAQGAGLWTHQSEGDKATIFNKYLQWDVDLSYFPDDHLETSHHTSVQACWTVKQCFAHCIEFRPENGRWISSAKCAGIKAGRWQNGCHFRFSPKVSAMTVHTGFRGVRQSDQAAGSMQNRTADCLHIPRRALD